MASTADLVKLAQRLVRDEPRRIEATSCRVRGLFNGKYAFDTTKAQHVWEVELRYPQYIDASLDSVQLAVVTDLVKIFCAHFEFHQRCKAILRSFCRRYRRRRPPGHPVGSRSTNRILLFHTGVLKDLVKVDLGAMDQWFEEDAPIYCHPKDPYKRIDMLPSARSVRVAVDGVTLAETSSALFLLETTPRTRYYIPPTSIKWERLRPSDVLTLCPYKGQAEYYHVNVHGKLHKNLVWYYR